MSPLEFSQFRLIRDLKKQISKLQEHQSIQCVEQNRLVADNRALQEKLVYWRQREIDRHQGLIVRVNSLRTQLASANALAEERETALADTRQDLNRMCRQYTQSTVMYSVPLFVLLAALIFVLFR